MVTWGSLAQGLLTGKYDANSKFQGDDRRIQCENFASEKLARNLEVVENLKRISRTLGRSPAEFAIRWLLDTPGVGSVLFGAKTPAQVEQNVSALGWRLSPEDYRLLDQAHSVSLEQDHPSTT